MSKRLVICFFLMIGISSLAEAAPRARRIGGPAAKPGAIAIPTLVNMPTIDKFVQDWPASPCGEIDPDRPCYMGGLTDPCIKATSYSTCKSRCECQFTANKKKCKTSAPCIDLAKAENEACLGNCVVDFT
jgi:hypothetical protein